MRINVQVTYDPEAAVWIATSQDLPGLATEAESQDVLLSKLQDIIPELIELNGISFPSNDGNVIRVTSEYDYPLAHRA